jgi:hypothetical protein
MMNLPKGSRRSETGRPVGFTAIQKCVGNLPKGSRRGFLGKPMAKAIILVMPYLMTCFNAVSELNIFPAGFAAGYSLVGACSGLSTYDE